MDTRQALLSGAILDLPGMHCMIQKEIGRGANAIVYQASYPDLLHPDEMHTVLIKELFPFHPKHAIYRAEDGFIVHTEESEVYWQKHQRSFEYGNRIHLRMLRRHPELTGENWNSLSKNGTLYTVLGYTGGRSLAEEMVSPEKDLRRLTIRMQLLLDALGDFHAEGYLHLDIAPDNILLIGNGRGERVMLIDYNSVHSVGQLGRDAETDFSMKQGYTAPEIRTRHFDRVSEATDLYSVTAVFFRCLTGAALTPAELIRAVPPDVSDCSALRDKPESVKAMVQQILLCGLQNLPKRRFASVRAMQEMLQELLDRIDGVGVTHWALWEAAKKTVTRVIRDNPALAYIQEDTLFPSDTMTADGAQCPTESFVEGLLIPGGQNSFLAAAGGMGKTTALLRTVWLHTRSYSPRKTAVTYIPLLSYSAGATSFVMDRLLENLHFKAETRSYADARHHLRELLDQPLRTREGEQPVLLLLLDGLNEVQGSTETLLKEIKELSMLRGVRILLTSRSGEAPDEFACAALSPLSAENVARQLSEKGLLLPKSAEMRELLRTPLMLSLFLRASLAEEKQLAVQNERELIDAYYKSLVEKARRETPKDTEAQWQMKAAVELVLPAIACEIQRKGRPLTDAELLPLVQKLYMLTKRKRLFKLFRWEGYTAAIRGGTENAEEWYGLIVHHILWKKLALLIRTNNGGYQLCHEIIGEYLSASGKGISKELKRLQLSRGACALLLIAAFMTVTWLAWPKPILSTPYDDTKASEILEIGETAYQYALRRTDAMRSVIERSAALAEELYSSPEDTVPSDKGRSSQKALSAELEKYQTNADYLTRLAKDKGISNEKTGDLSTAVNDLLSSGTYFASSGEAFSEQDYWELLALESRYYEDYNQLLGELPALTEHQLIEEWYGVDFRVKLEQLAGCDAEIAEILFCLAVLPHLPEDAFDMTTLRYIGVGEDESSVLTERKALEKRLQVLRESRDGQYGMLPAAQNIAEAIHDLNERY